MAILNDFYEKDVKPIEYIVDGECFICTSHARSGDYFKIKRNGKSIDLHVWINKVYNGEAPKGMVVRHLCNNSKCINPNHLKSGTYEENEQDKHLAGTYYKRSGENLKKQAIKKRIVGEEGMAWCNVEKAFLPIENFGKSKRRWNGLKAECKECRKKSSKIYRENKKNR